MLSRKAKYALRALLALAEDGDFLMIADIAERRSIPKKFLEQILLDLKHNGIVTSRRGKNGGYALMRPSDRISLADIMRIIDGPIAPLPCLSKTSYQRCDDCDGETECALRHAFARAHEANVRMLEGTSLASLLPQPPEETSGKKPILGAA